MKSIKKNLTKTLPIIALITLTFQSSSQAGQAIDSSYPLAKDLEAFSLFKPKKESMVPLNKNIKIFFHTRQGESISLDKQLKYPVKNLNGRTSLSIRDMASIFNLDINWQAQHRLVQVQAKNQVLRFPLDKNIVAINNRLKPLNVAATVDEASGRTYLPVRYLLENLGYKVVFKPKEKTINIYE